MSAPVPLHVACGGSLEYVPHTGAMLHSVLAHRGRLELVAHYLHAPGLRADTARALTEMVEREGGTLQLLEVSDERIAGLPRMRHIPATMWYRTFLPELLPEVDRVLYLDADTIAVDSLEPLWATELGDHYFAAVTNVWEPWNVGYAAALGLAGPNDYFNSGVMLMNLALLRADAATARVVDYALAHRDRLPWGDQDALNVVLGHRRLHLRPRWNCMNSVLYFAHAAETFGADAVAEARRSPGIRHFEGPSINKPWHLLCDWEGREAYLRHRRQTPWPRFRPEGMTPRNLTVRLWRDLRRRRRPRRSSGRAACRGGASRTPRERS